MAIFRLLILVFFVGFAFAKPLDTGSSCRCGSACPCTSAEKKFSYTPGKSYIYSYEGHSEVVLDGVPTQAQSRLNWKAEVTLTWLCECEVAVQISKPVVNGLSDDHILTQLLALKPMIATFNDGVVTGVFPDQDDHPTGLNLKKGVMSLIQNVLPSLSSSIVNQTFVEIDVLGRCPTTYTVKDLLINWSVSKSKNHKHCSGQYNSDDNHVASWLMQPRMPLFESISECTQLIAKGDNITTKVYCRDENVIKAVPPKQLTAVQESSLTLMKIVTDHVVPKVNSHRHKKDLIFKVLPQPVTKEVVPKIEKLLGQLGVSMEGNISRETASYVAKMAGLLYRVPEDSFRKMLGDIRNGHYCKNFTRLEAVFLDAMSFIGNAGAVQVMVDEITSGKIKGGRTAMYTIALHLLQNPSIHSVEAVIPLFSSEHSEYVCPSMTLAAGSLVRKYCRSHPHCLQDTPVKNILRELTNVVESSCFSSSDSRNRTKVLAALKTIGNIANITKTVEDAVLKCVQSKEADVYIRVAAAQAYRHASCYNQPTVQLIEIALSPSENAEVRIASYVAAIKCADYEQMEKLVWHLSREANTQVRSFILSHLHNLQRSDAPYLRGLRYNLSSFIIPTDYEQDLRKYSFNSDYSYYLPTLGIGAGVDTSVIYTPGSYLPRQLQTNITVDLFNNVINIGEFAIRIEDIEVVIDALFGTNGYIYNTPLQKIKEDLLKEALLIKEEIKRNTSKDMGSLDAILQTIHSHNRGSEGPMFDAFARILGQEVLFGSVTPDFSRALVGKWLNQLMRLVTELMIEASNLTADSARALQVNFEYFVPTVQGIPLQLKMVGTGVLALRVESDIKREESRVRTVPGLSFAVNSFVGYSFGVKTGLRTRVEALTVSDHSMKVNITKQEVEAIVDIPHHLTLFNATGHCYMMNKMPGREDQRTGPKKDYPVSHVHRCSPNTFAASAGLDACVDMSFPNFIKADIFPLGDYKAMLTVNKMSPHNHLVRAKGRAEMKKGNTEISMELALPGSKTPMKGEMGVKYTFGAASHSLSVFGETPNIPRKIMQFDLKNINTPHSQRLHFTTYYAQGKRVSPSDQVFDFQLEGAQTEKEVEGKLDLMTKSLLSRYIKADIHVDVATKLSKSSRQVDIRKFETSIVLPTILNTTTFVRKGQLATGPSSYQYHIYSLTRTPSWEMLRFNGTVDSEGEISKMNYESRFNLSVNASSNCFYCESAFVWTDQLKHVLLSVKNENDRHYSFMANSSICNEPSSPSSYYTNTEIQIPSIMPTYKLEGLVHHNTSRNYHLNLFSKEEDGSVYQVAGLVSIDKSPEGFKQKTDITVKHLNVSQEYTVVSKLLVYPEKMGAKVDVKSNGVSAIFVEGEFEREGDMLTSGASLTIPKIVDAELEAKTTSSLLHLALNAYLKPNTPESQKMKAYTSVDFSEKKINARYVYDLDKNPKNLELKAKYNYDMNKMFASVKGDVKTTENEYAYSAEGIFGIIADEYNNTNAINIVVKNPKMAEEILLFDCDYICNSFRFPKSHILNTFVKYSPEEDAESAFKVDSKFDLEIPNPPSQMSLKGNFKFDNQLIKEMTLIVDSSVDLKESDQKAHYKVELLRGEQREPISKTHLEFANMLESFSAKMLMSFGSSSELDINGKIEMTRPENQVFGDGSLEFSVKIPMKDEYALKATKTDTDAEIYLSRADRKILAFKQSFPQDGRWQARLITPLREAEVHSKYSPNSISLSLYPNRKESETKYELEGHYHHSSVNSGSRLDTGALFKYPGNENGLGIRTDVAMGKSSSQGTIMLDIFADPKKKVFIGVLVSKLSDYDYKVAADLKIPASNVVPQVEFNITMSPNLKQIKMLVKKASSSAPTLESFVSFVRSTDKDSSFFARLRTPFEHYEMISAFQSHELFQCRGASMNGTFVSRRHGSYHFASAVCAPGYIEFGAKNVSDGKMFVAKFGMKNPASIKVALDVVYNSSQAITLESARNVEHTLNLYGQHEYVPKIPMFVVGATLWSPKIVSVDVYYNVTGIKEYLESVLNPTLIGAKRICEEFVEQIPKNLEMNMPEILPSLKTELKKMREYVVHEVESVLHEIGVSSLPSWSDILEEIKNILLEMLQTFKQIVKIIKDFFEKYFNIHPSDNSVLETCEGESEDWLQCLFTNIEHILERGIEILKEIPVLKSVVDWIEDSSLIEYLKKMIHLCKEMFKNIVDFFKSWYHDIANEVKDILKSIANNKYVKEIISWITSWLHRQMIDEDSILAGSPASRFFSINVNETIGLLRFQVPLRRPVSSLSAALSSVGISLPCQELFHYVGNPPAILESVLEPRSASARIEENHLTTFDGLVVPLRYSKCEILMAKVFNDEITVTKLNERKMEVTVILQSGKKFKMYLDAENLPRVPILGKVKELTLPGATITKISNNEVRVDLKGLTLYIQKDNLIVKAKSMAFSKVDGLLGNHDSEKSNDVQKGGETGYFPGSFQGNHHLSKGVRKLFERYRVDRSCVIPRI